METRRERASGFTTTAQGLAGAACSGPAGQPCSRAASPARGALTARGRGLHRGGLQPGDGPRQAGASSWTMRPWTVGDGRAGPSSCPVSEFWVMFCHESAQRPPCPDSLRRETPPPTGALGAMVFSALSSTRRRRRRQSHRLSVSLSFPSGVRLSRLLHKRGAAAPASSPRTFWPPRVRREASAPRLGARDARCPHWRSRDLRPPPGVPTSHLHPAPSPRAPGFPQDRSSGVGKCHSVSLGLPSALELLPCFLKVPDLT